MAAFVARALWVRIADLLATGTDPGDFRYAWAAPALACLWLAAGFAGATLRVLTHSVGARVDWKTAMAATWTPRVGKYVPGKAMSVIGAVWLLGREGVPAPAATTAVLVKTGVVTLVSLIVAAPVTLMLEVRQGFPAALWITLGLIAIFALCLHPRVFRGVADRVLRRLGRPPLQRFPRAADYAGAIACAAGQWVMTGLALLLAARVVADVPFADVLLYVPAASLAAALGFVAVFAPAGLGVQEGVLLLVLSPTLGAGPAALVAVLMRLLQTISDVTAALAGMAILRARNGARHGE